MTELSLPASVNYTKLPQLPDGVTSTLMSVQSTNGISFSQGKTLP